jgi:type III secretion protein L
MVLKVHPEDGKILREKRPRLMELIGRAVDIAIRDDAEVERGGCIIQTEYGTIDGQIRTQFEMLRNVLMPDTAKKENK